MSSNLQYLVNNDFFLTLGYFLHLFRLLKQNVIDWVAYKQQIFLSHSSGKSQSQDVSTVGFRQGAFFLVADCWLLPVFSHGGRGEKASLGLFDKGTSVMHEGSTLMTLSPL